MKGKILHFHLIKPNQMKKILPTTLKYPKEWIPLLEMRRKFKAFKPDRRPLNELSSTLSDIEFCYVALSKVSRSFSVVIRMLPDELRNAVCVFYLVLRGLDTVEDDTNTDKEIRIHLLTNFYTFLHNPKWNISGIGTNDDYKMLLLHFDKVIASYQELDEKYQKIIQRICKEMGKGMTLLLDRDLRDVEEYDEYCYYVAGLVGIGLSELFVQSGEENSGLADQVELQVAMGQFLQKTNIIRDFREDLDEERSFWPQDVWRLYSNDPEELCEINASEAVFCLNHMITDALNLAPKCLEYLKMIRNPQIFQFCAIPQVMAIATLAEIFNNPDVFQKNVKIRKGLSAVLFLNTTTYHEAREVFFNMAETIFDKLSLSDPNINEHVNCLKKILEASDTFTVYSKRRSRSWEKMENQSYQEQLPVYNSVT